MDKKHFDSFFDATAKLAEYELFKFTLPLTLIYKNIFNETELFLKNNYDLIHSEIDVLAALYFNGKILSPTDLYAATLYSSGGMTKVLKKLEAKKYISRKASKDDKRSMLVCLEKKGEELTKKCLTEISNNRANLLDILTKEENEILKTLLTKIAYSQFK